MRKLMLATTALVTAALCTIAAVSSADAANPKAPKGLAKIGHIVVIYAENHSFDEEFGTFPGANGLKNVGPGTYTQLDRDGSVLAKLPPVFGGVIDSHLVPPTGPLTQIPQSATTNMPNKPFAINSQSGFNVPASVATRDLYHRFYENQMQIDGGKNDMFAAWADSGGLVMGHYDYTPRNKNLHPLWQLAKDFVLADNFYQAAFGGSYLNHQFLICACANTLTPAQQVRPKVSGPGTVTVPVSVLNADGVTLTTAANSPASSLNGAPVFVNSAVLTPLDQANNVYYGVNTMQPPYVPSGNANPGLPQTSVNLDSTTTVPPQTNTTIGDLLSAANVSWAWYAGAMQYAIDHGTGNGAAGLDPHLNNVPNFQTHHNPFNYYLNFAPGTQARADHLKDGGLNGDKFLQDIDAGNLPAVTFYKPQGNLNGHPGYTDLTLDDEHVIDVVHHLMASPQWNDMVVIVTYDEFGGQWDHAAPPKGDKFGPGTRIPALIISPFAKRHNVDHTQYDTTSILKLITEKYALPVLPGLAARDAALIAHGGVANGDLTGPLNLN